MIVNALLQLIYHFIAFLLMPITIPSLPSGVVSVLNSVLSYISDGLNIFAAFTHFDYISGLFVATIAIDAAMIVYKFIRWLLQKIPAAGIE